MAYVTQHGRLQLSGSEFAVTMLMFGTEDGWPATLRICYSTKIPFAAKWRYMIHEAVRLARINFSLSV